MGKAAPLLAPWPPTLLHAQHVMTLAVCTCGAVQGAHGFGLVGSWNALQSSGGGLQGFMPQPRRAHDKHPACVERCDACPHYSPHACRGLDISWIFGPPLHLLQLTLVSTDTGGVQRRCSMEAASDAKHLCIACSMRRGWVRKQGVHKELYPSNVGARCWQRQ